MKLRRRLAVLPTTAALLAGVHVTAGATTANAAGPCSPTQVSNDSSGGGHFKGTHMVKFSPAAECGTRALVHSGTTCCWCYAHNYYGNKWVYGRQAGTQVYGWTSMDATWEEGSLNYCCP